MLVVFLPVGVITGLACGWWSHKGRVWPVVPAFVFALPAMLALHAMALALPEPGRTLSPPLPMMLDVVRVQILAPAVALPGLAALLMGLAAAAVAGGGWDRRRFALGCAGAAGLTLLVLAAGWASDEWYLGVRRAAGVGAVGGLAAVAAADRERPELPVVACAALAMGVGFIEMAWRGHAHAEILGAMINIPEPSRLTLLQASLEYVAAARPWQWAALLLPTTAATVVLGRWNPGGVHGATAWGVLIGPIALVLAWLADGSIVLESVEAAWRLQ